MPQAPGVATHVVTIPAVKWAIATLGSQKIHPTFVPYLYLHKLTAEGRLDEASASSAELLDLIRMPGNPNKPYYHPLINRGDRTSGELLATFWKADNVAVSWSQGSIFRLSAGAWMSDGVHYVMPGDHASRAKSDMLYGATVPAVAVSAYFLRNDGLILDTNEGTGADLIAAFRSKFTFVDDAEFNSLFDLSVPDAGFDWLEPFIGDAQGGE